VRQQRNKGKAKTAKEQRESKGRQKHIKIKEKNNPKKKGYHLGLVGKAIALDVLNVAYNIGYVLTDAQQHSRWANLTKGNI
jgi:hypothetical protein